MEIKNRLAILLLLGGSLLATVQAAPQKGISLQSTRLIYPENMHKGITFTIQNDTTVPYLIQSRISDRIPGDIIQHNGNTQQRDAPFIVLPPLKKLAPNEQLALVIRITKNQLPKDRESAFSFHIKAIPSKPDNSISDDKEQLTSTVQVSLALQNTLKLFYRPNGLPHYNIKKIADSLRFSRTEKALVVTNPGPFYVTFHSLTVGDSAVDRNTLFQMVPPYGQRTYPLSSLASGTIRWQLLNDYGQATDTYTHPPIK